MARGRQPPPQPQPANLSAQQIKAAVPKLKRRLGELQAVEIDRWDDGVQQRLDGLQQKVEDTLMGVFGAETQEYKRFEVPKFWYSVSMTVYGTPDHEWVEGYKQAIRSAAAKLETAIELLEEKLQDMGEDPSSHAIQVMEGMDLHPEIGRAAGPRFRAGHYADAVEAACKVLTKLVQIRSGDFDRDGTDLMRRVFSPKNPVLSFSPFPFQDRSYESEQEGMMHLYAGAMLALRNPKAHKLVDDHPESAMEYVGFVGLLAKLLDDTEAA